ncbi:MAG: DUF4124 domain-containing protein [Xanthomonadales bacterium]|nr:hypothetical protein [Xanthomonadales bacterium]MCC6594180.1 DUF4124 domain-containing protein [Xanthomonadales bacterium]MCE7931664.1 DUF4124 domain-containing protein [Xanthomonadales bacterium PRO6]
MIRSLFLFATLALPVFPAAAATIYKCRQAGGVTSYQDAPCPGRQIGVLRTPAAPAPTRAAAPVASTAASAASTAGRPNPQPALRSPRPSFKCEKPDGSLYFTGVASTRRSLVDLHPGATVAWLADAPAAPPGKAWAQDRCRAATRTDSCDYYRQQIARNDASQAAARGLELRKLTREGQRLKAIFNHRCDG